MIERRFILDDGRKTAYSLQEPVVFFVIIDVRDFADHHRSPAGLTVKGVIEQGGEADALSGCEDNAITWADYPPYTIC